MSIFRQPRWMATLKMSSPRVVGAEIVNSENLLSTQMADGALLLYKTGREYRNIPPVWDYTEIPGITTNIPADTCTPFRNGSYAEFRGGNPFTGGLVLSDSVDGASAMILERNGLKAGKAWFFSENYIICRGTGISSPQVSAVRPVRTTVAQQLAVSPVTVTLNNGKKQTYQIGQPIIFQNPTWPVLIEHAGVGYWFPEPETAKAVTVSSGPVTGNWGRFAAMYDTTPVTENIFSITISHGSAPQGVAYDYVIIPEMHRVNRNSLLRNRQIPFSLHRSEPSLLAVEHPEQEIKEAVFFQAGTAVFADGTEITVSAPCILSFEKRSLVSLVDPTCQVPQITVTVRQKGREIDSAEFDTRNAAGKTLRQCLY